MTNFRNRGMLPPKPDKPDYPSEPIPLASDLWVVLGKAFVASIIIVDPDDVALNPVKVLRYMMEAAALNENPEGAAQEFIDCLIAASSYGGTNVADMPMIVAMPVKDEQLTQWQKRCLMFIAASLFNMIVK